MTTNSSLAANGLRLSTCLITCILFYLVIPFSYASNLAIKSPNVLILNDDDGEVPRTVVVKGGSQNNCPAPTDEHPCVAPEDGALRFRVIFNTGSDTSGDPTGGKRQKKQDKADLEKEAKKSGGDDPGFYFIHTLVLSSPDDEKAIYEFSSGLRENTGKYSIDLKFEHRPDLIEKNVYYFKSTIEFFGGSNPHTENICWAINASGECASKKDDPTSRLKKAQGRFAASGQVKDVSNIGSDIALSLFPNPARSTATLQYKLEETTDLGLKIMGMDGKVYMNLGTHRLGAGLHEMNIDLAKVPTGIYVVQAAWNERKEYTRFIVAK